MKIHLYTRTVVLVVLAALSATGMAQEDAKTQVISIEKSLWEAWKARDAQPFNMHLTDDSMNIGANGITVGKAKVVELITGGDCDIKSSSLSDWTLHQVSADTAILTYRASQEGTCGGEKIPAAVLASSVYVKQNGKWMAASYHETPVSK